MSHYDALGVGKDASPDEIRRAYRSRAQKAHPDKGGSDEKFHAIQRAYETLGNEERKTRYDTTGEDDQPVDSIRAEAMGQIASILVHAVEQLEVERQDIIGAVHQAIDNGERGLLGQIRKAEHGIAKMEKALGRLKKKGRGVDLVGQMLQAEINKRRASLASAEREKERVKVMREILADYTYTVDMETFVTFVTSTASWR